MRNAVPAWTFVVPSLVTERIRLTAVIGGRPIYYPFEPQPVTHE